ASSPTRRSSDLFPRASRGPLFSTARRARLPRGAAVGHHGRMPPHDPRIGNTARGPVHGQFLQARDIHRLTAASAPGSDSPEIFVPDISLDPPHLATAIRGRTRLIEELTASMGSG